MASQSISKTDIIVKGILGSQIMSVPFACALSSISVVLASRFLSKTSTTRPPLRRYFEYQAGATRPTRMVLARLGAVLVATVCVTMTIMELTIVYQTAVTHSADADFQRVVPWTSSMVPLLSSIVSIASQSYFSDKILHQVQNPKLFFPFLMLLGLGSLSIGTAATISLLIQPFQSPTVRGVAVSEALFWAYLVIATLSSLVISIILTGSYLKDRRSMIMESRRSGQDLAFTKTTSILRFFLSTYTLVFLFDLMCLITSIVSSSPNFDVAFNASKAFLVLQKLMVRIMAVSYLYALLDGVPKNPIFTPPNQLHLKGSYATPSEPGFKAPRSNPDPAKASKSKLKKIQNSVSRTLNKYESEKHKALAAEDAEGEIFSYSYPPNSACSMTAKAVRTPGVANFKYDWEPITHNLDAAAPSSAKRSQYNFSPGPAWNSHTGYSHYPPSMPSVPTQFRETQPLPALPRNA
ncbi:hypothetical protein PCANC_23212 [Puccinia coronata f. sp. avenae]|uniref:Uncharacterized protein n=1 Tax=Puccinia coronata f. sp. avenae TaxID=200324 RepID=A0A2N5S819_9BASI|nr:hypothetical protein PCANC_23212 [Puccinia coronata f. sp. avenae]PLW27856.1 hypothetical protein PCASD_18752 [Puccinia coronata f. sp. avenae]